MNYYDKIKEKLVDNEIYKRTKDYSKNKNDIMTYYDVGKLLIEAQGGEIRAKYGDDLIKEYSKKLSNEIGKKYTVRYLQLMRQFYLFQKTKPVVSQLTWSHYVILLRLKDENMINYYITQIINRNLSKRRLQDIIKSKEYERLDNKTKEKLIKKEKTNIIDKVKNPIIIKNNKQEKISEKVLQQLILEDIPSFLSELGEGFTFIKNEYPIKIGEQYNYIDLLLFNYIYNCFVVIELKVTTLKKEHIGQIQIYMNYIDKNLKTINQGNTIGIIVVRKNNKYVIEYASDKRIISRVYELI